MGQYLFLSYCVLKPNPDIVMLTNESDNTTQTELGLIVEKIVDAIDDCLLDIFVSP